MRVSLYLRGEEAVVADSTVVPHSCHDEKRTAVIGSHSRALQMASELGKSRSTLTVKCLISLWILRTLVSPAIASAGRVALTAVLQYGVDHGANIREHKDLASAGRSGQRQIPAAQCPR
jgi:hypothetical protein